MKKKLVILGAGIGGLSVVDELIHSGVRLREIDVTVVDKDFSHVLGFTLPWVMRGWRDHRSVPIRPSASALSAVHTVTGTVRAVDPAARAVTLDQGSRLEFDALIIATGARNAIGGIPGLRDAVDAGTAVHYYSVLAAARAHQALRTFTGGKLVFLVTSQPYRCPVAPYEGSLLAADLLRDNGSRENTTLSIYTPEKHPMPSAGPYAGPELVELLHDNGVGFFGEHAVTHIVADRNEIHFHRGESAVYDLLIFIPPHEPVLTLDEPGWIPVDAVTMQTRHPGIFAIGDTTAVISPSGRPLPKAAIFAKNGAKAAAANALHYLGHNDAIAPLSGWGHCYVDTGDGRSALGEGDFFTLPHPAIHLSPPSETLHHDKGGEERDWRARWESDTAKAG